MVVPCTSARPGLGISSGVLPRPSPCGIRAPVRPLCLNKAPSNAYRTTPGVTVRPGAHVQPRRCAAHSASASSAFGQALPGATSMQLPGRRNAASSWVHLAAFRRGAKLIVCATMAPTADDVSAVRDMLSRKITPEPELVVGQLENGMRYVLLPNKLPPQRFEAHLEVHAGSVDERENEQGVAHLVEHVTFLGSKRREELLGTGARANAYTDFHHTVFHVHAPAVNGITGQPMLPQVLEALEEIAFAPQFSASRIEKERKAVLAEAQMMNTIEYRVDCQLLTYLHEENALGCRFPIGLTEQVKAWPHEVLKGFWERWYFPANVTLYVVGDLDRSTPDAIKLIEKVFGKLQPVRLPAPAPDAALANGNGHAANGNGSGHSQAAIAAAAQQLMGPLKQRQAVRPPVQHKWGYGPLAPAEQPAEVKIFRHPLLQHFMLSVFCKLPIQPMNTMQHLKNLLMMRILLSVFQFRINGRYVLGDPKFLTISLDISDSGREGCAVSTLTVSSEPADWHGAVGVAVQEMRRMQRHGITQGEFERYCKAILRDSAQLAEQANKIPSVDTLNFVMESLACGHTVMSHREAHQAMMAVAETVTLTEVNALARSMLSFASDYGSEGELLAAAAADALGTWAGLGPTRATSIVACVPAYMDASGQSVSAGSMAGRGGSLGAAGHLDADTIDLEQLEKDSQKAAEFEVPEGAVKFDPSPAEIAAALADTSLDCSPAPDVDLPEMLVAPERLEALIAERQPSFVPVAPNGNAFPPPDPNSGIVQRRLSNGIAVNYRYTDNEPRSGLLRLIANGGRIAERPGVGNFGNVVVGARTISESGAVGEFAREQIEVFCVANLLNCALDADEENIVMDFHFSCVEGGMEAMFQMIHMFLESPRWEDSAMERAKDIFLSSVKSIPKSLERNTSEKLMEAMLGRTERCFREPTPEELQGLTMQGMKKAVHELLVSGNFELSVVGDFDAAELETLLLQYVGTVQARPPPPAPLYTHPIHFRSPPMDQRHQTWHLRDSDERAVAYIGGPAPARWGPLGFFGPLEALPGPVKPPVASKVVMDPASKAEAEASRRNHPLFSSVMLMLLTEIINSRLFTTVRDSLGLTYDVAFEVTLFDRIRAGWFMVHVTSHPDKIFDALNASVSVLRDIRIAPINRRELARAKTTLLTRHESDLKDNAYWLGLLTHLQNPNVPHKTLECLRDLTKLYEAATVEDVKLCYDQFNFDDEHIFTCVGTSGKAPPPVPERVLSGLSYLGSDDDEDEEGQLGAGQQGQAAGGMPNPMALFTAWMAAAQSANIRTAIQQQQPNGPDSQGNGRQ